MEERRKCYISYKYEDQYYKDEIVKKFGGEYFINKSQKKFLESDSLEYIIQTIKKENLDDTTVTIFLIGKFSGENYRTPEDLRNHLDSQAFIRREITASLYNGNKSTRNGLLGIVLPTMYDKVYGGSDECPCCHRTINYVNINDDTVIKEFGQNYYLKRHGNPSCTHFNENDRYAVLVKYDDFMENPQEYIERAYQKRNEPIANEVKVRSFD